VFRLPDARVASPQTWLLPLDRCDDSAVVVWPCREQIIGESGDSYFVPGLSVSEVQLVTIVQLEGIIAKPFVWRSPLHQLKTYPKYFAGQQLGIRAFVAGRETTVLDIAARAGFWALKKSYLSELGRH
jgi:hypothetical protein